MKKIIYLLFTLLAMSQVVCAQEIENGVLKSWAQASGAIRIPDGVTEIAENCFYKPDDTGGDWGGGGWEDGGYAKPLEAVSNTAITSVDLNGVVKIGKNAFHGCTGIQQIKAPKVQVIEEGAFEGCNSLISISLPAIQNIGLHAFADNDVLQTIQLGSGLTTLVGNPFKNTPQVKMLVMMQPGTAYKTLNNALISIADGTLVAFAGGIPELSLDSECVKVGEEAFFGATTLKKLSLPYVTEIGNKAFTNCSSLEELIVPRLERVVDDSFIQWQGVGSLKVIDIHLSPNFNSFGYSLTLDATTTVYVADAKVQARIQSEYPNAQVVVGEPQSLKHYTVTYTGNNGGKVEAWTTGAVDVNSGDEVVAGAMIKIKATPLFGYTIESWMVNGQKLTEPLPTDGTNGQIYTVDAIDENLNVEVIFAALPESHMIFFHSRSESGTLTCRIKDGAEVKSGTLVPVGSTLVFTATPNKGFRVADWYKLDNNASPEKYVVIDGMNGKTTYECAEEQDLDIQVDFERVGNSHIVKFESLNTFGTLTATVNDQAITSGDAIAEGSKVVFTAHPIEGYAVDDWLLDNEVIIGYKADTYTIDNLTTDVEVTIVFSQKKEDENHAPVIRNGHLISWQPVGAAVIPDEVTHIDAKAFEGAMEMTAVTIGKNVTFIGELPFLYCAELKTITVDPANTHFVAADNVVFTKDKAVLVAYPLGSTATTYTVPASVKTVVPGAFNTALFLEAIAVESGNSSLKAIDGMLYTADGQTLLYFPPQKQPAVDGNIPENTTTLARLSLAYNPTLNKLTIPLSLKKIEPLALAYNMNLEFAGTMTEALLEVEEVGDSAFYYARTLKEMPLFFNLKRIGKYAFALASNMTKVFIPDGCTIAEGAFAKCEALNEVRSFAKVPPVIAPDMFTDIAFIDEATLYVPAGSEEAYKSAEGWKVFTHIKSDDPTAVSLVNDSPLRVSRSTNLLRIAGIKPHTPYALYTLAGTCVAKGVAVGDEVSITLSDGETLLILRVQGLPAIKL